MIFGHEGSCQSLAKFQTVVEHQQPGACWGQSVKLPLNMNVHLAKVCNYRRKRGLRLPKCEVGVKVNVSSKMDIWECDLAVL